MLPFSLPTDYTRIKTVRSFEDLVTVPFENGLNALCWERTLAGDFAQVVNHLGVFPVGITSLEDERLRALSASLNDSGREAIEVMLTDLQRLRDHGREPELNAVISCLRDENPGPVRTDVCSFHVDSATAETDTFLCTYHGASSEGLQSHEAVRKVDVPETRTELLRSYREDIGEPEAQDDEAFLEWLSENCYDLHYAKMPDARPFSFGVGNLWRIAVQWPGCPVPACIHRAPDEDSQPKGVRLLLIS
jgi:hypothetical protein